LRGSGEIRARRDRREGKSPTTQAGEFVREEIRHIRSGRPGARSSKQAIAIGLSKARRAGVKLSAPPRSAKATTRKKRSRAAARALKREPRGAASRAALARQSRQATRRRGLAARQAAARRAVAMKGADKRRAAARKAAATRKAA
jgi:hypothetical protein